MRLHDFLSYCSTWVVVLPSFVGLLYFKSLRALSRLIFFLVIIALVPQLIFAFRWGFDSSVALSYNIYTILEFFVMLFFLFKLFDDKKLLKFFLIHAGLFLFAAIIFFSNYSFTNDFASELVFFTNFGYTFWLLYYLFKIMKDEDGYLSFSSSETWFLSGFLLYAPTSALIFLFWNYKANEISILKFIGFVQNLFNIVLYVFISIGFYMDLINSRKCRIADS